MDRNKFVEVCTQKFLIAPELAERYADEAENNGRTYEAVLGVFAEMVAKNRKREITNYKFLRHSCGETHMEKQNYSISAISKLFEGVDGHDLRLTVKVLTCATCAQMACFAGCSLTRAEQNWSTQSLHNMRTLV